MRGCEVRGDAGQLTNPDEASAVVMHAHALLLSGVSPSEIAIISPYAAQVALIRAMLAAKATDVVGAGAPGGAPGGTPGGVLVEGSVSGIEVATVDSFQGREADAVIISLVRSNRGASVGFLSDERRWAIY